MRAAESPNGSIRAHRKPLNGVMINVYLSIVYNCYRFTGANLIQALHICNTWRKKKTKDIRSRYGAIPPALDAYEQQGGERDDFFKFSFSHFSL